MDKWRFCIVLAIVVVLLGLGAFVALSAGRTRAASNHALQGNTLYRSGKYSEAIAEYSKSLELSPHQGRVLAFRGFCYAYMKQYPSAIRDFSATLAERDVSDTLRMNIQNYRGKAYSDTGMYHESLDDYHAVINSPKAQSALNRRELAYAYNGVAWILATCPDAQLRNADEAVQDVDRALALCEKDQRAEMLDTLAAADARKGDYPTAYLHELDAIAANQQPEYAGNLNDHLALFKAGKPYTMPEVSPK